MRHSISATGFIISIAGLATPGLAQIHPLDPSMLTVSSDPSVLVSRHYGLAWYRAGIPLVGRTLADLDDTCGTVKTKIGGPWRAPTRAELETLTYRIWPRQVDNSRAFHDTPDRRHFGRIMPPPTANNAYTSFPASDWRTDGGGVYWHTVMRAYWYGVVSFETNSAYEKREVKYPVGYRLLCVSTLPAGAIRR